MRALLVAVLATGCGLGGSVGGGADNLPILGAGPYGKLADDPMSPAIEPYVVTDLMANLGDPSALDRDGGGYRLWYTRNPRDGSPASIYRSDVAKLGQNPLADPAPSLGPTETWEAGAVRAPSVVDLRGPLVMAYQAGAVDAPAIGLATSDTDGGPWIHAAAPIITNATDPALIVVGDTWRIYFNRPDAPGIFLAVSTDGGATFTIQPDPVLVPRGTDAGAFDRLWIGQPAAVGGISEAGQLRIGLFYVGKNALRQFAIGYAGSDDGVHFERFFNGRAVLQPGGEDEHAPSAVIHTADSVLFFTQQNSAVQAIAAATQP